jgi:NAD-dependent deacetylase
MKEKIREVAELLSKAKAVAVLTGAGVSKESGIPTFRDAQTGLWANFNPEDLATPRAFRRNPGLVWQWYDFRRQAVEKVAPNPGHVALVEIEQKINTFTLVTQNVDGLHVRAGSKNVIELHGNIRLTKCFDNEHRAEEVPFGLKEPPKCHCGSLLRPDVVWFEEALPAAELRAATVACESCDVMLVVGTSGLVQPAASLPLVASRAGATLVEINPGKTPLTTSVDIYLDGPSGEILPAVVKAFEGLNF